MSARVILVRKIQRWWSSCSSGPELASDGFRPSECPGHYCSRHFLTRAGPTSMMLNILPRTCRIRHRDLRGYRKDKGAESPHNRNLEMSKVYAQSMLPTLPRIPFLYALLSEALQVEDYIFGLEVKIIWLYVVASLTKVLRVMSCEKRIQALQFSAQDKYASDTRRY